MQQEAIEVGTLRQQIHANTGSAWRLGDGISPLECLLIMSTAQEAMSKFSVEKVCLRLLGATPFSRIRADIRATGHCHAHQEDSMPPKHHLRHPIHKLTVLVR